MSVYLVVMIGVPMITGAVGVVYPMIKAVTESINWVVTSASIYPINQGSDTK